MEQDDLDATPDLFDSPHIRLDIATEYEARKDIEYKKRKREDDNRTGYSENVPRANTAQMRSSTHEDDTFKKYKRLKNHSKSRSKRRSHESDRLERLERERKRLESERLRQLDRIQKGRDHEKEVVTKEEEQQQQQHRHHSGRTGEQRRKDGRKGRRKSIISSMDDDRKRSKRSEHKERRSVKLTANLTSASLARAEGEQTKEHKRRDKKSIAVEPKGAILDVTPKSMREENKECTDAFTSVKVADIKSQKNEDDESIKGSLNFKNDEAEQLEIYGLYHFARSKFDDDDEDDEETGDSPFGNGKTAPLGGKDCGGVSPIPEVADDREKPDPPEDRGVGLRRETPVPPLVESAAEEPELPAYYPAIQGCRSVEEFHCLNRINEGTYGVVYRAVDLKLREVVALKRLKMEKEKDGFPITSLREIKLLMKARHPNVVTIKEVVVGSNMDKIYLVMEYVEHDMKSLMESMKEPFTIGEVKTLLIQLLRGVQHLHDNWIIHRDLKTSNLLLSHSGILKIGDFGLAREYGSPLKPYTPVVVTLWYRSPELLLGTKTYSTAVDVWSVGCIFAEFLLRKPLFPGATQIEQLNCIFKDLGTPNEEIWPGLTDLPGMKKATFTQYQFNQLRRRFEGQISEKGFHLMNSLLTFCPERRATSDSALAHDYFAETPLPTHPAMFPTWPAKSELCRTRKSPKAPSGGKTFQRKHEENVNYGSQRAAMAAAEEEKEERSKATAKFPVHGNPLGFRAF